MFMYVHVCAAGRYPLIVTRRRRKGRSQVSCVGNRFVLVCVLLCLNSWPALYFPACGLLGAPEETCWEESKVSG